MKKTSVFATSTAAILLGLFGTLSSPVYASSANSEKQVVDDNDKIICRSIMQTGTRMGNRRTCKPRSEWERERQAANGERFFHEAVDVKMERYRDN